MSATRASRPAFVALAAALSLPAQSEPGNAAGALLAVLPDEAVAVAWIAEPASAADTFVQALSPVPEGLPVEAVARIGFVVTAVKAAIEDSAAAWATRLMGGGLAVAAVPAAAGEPLLLAVSRPADVESALTWCGKRAPKMHVAAAGGLLLASNRREGIEMLRARAVGTAGRWAGFAFGEGLQADDSLRIAVDLELLRRIAPQPPAVTKLAGRDRLVLAPIVDAVDAAKWLRIGFSPALMRLTMVADAGVRPPFDALIAQGARGRQVVPLPEDGLALLTVDRSVRALFQDLERFLPESDVLAARGFLSIADALDGPSSSFVDDLLGGLAEPFTLHVLAAGPADGERSPFVLPAFALSAPVANADVDSILFRLSQIFATIANAERMQRGQSPFVMRRINDETGHYLVAEPGPWRGPGDPPIDRQLSPTVWCGKDRVVIATTVEAARHVATAPASMHVRGDLLVLRGPAIAAAIEVDRAMFELARMLDEGEDRAAAAKFLDIVNAVARDLAEVRLGWEGDGASTKLHLTLERRR